MNYTIGLLFDSLIDEYENAIWQEIVKLARRKHINLVSFAVGAINSPYKQNSKRNIIYKFVNKKIVDGLICFTASLSNFSTPAKIAEMYNRFQDLPIVSIGQKLEDHPAILINNEVGMFQIMDHLINYHKYKRIAFIKGPDGNKEAELRFKVYENCLVTNKIPIQTELIVQGDFCRLSGVKAIVTLLDERRAQFDAVVAANDYMALDAMIELERRGIQVPADIAVTGFDDMFESRCTLHPITTVRQPSYKIAKKALSVLIGILQNGVPSDPPALPTKAVIRRSCGCFMYMHTRSLRKSPVPSIKQRILEEMNFNFPDFVDSSLMEGWVQDISDALHSSLEGEEDKFLRILEEILIDSFHNNVNPLAWYPVMTCLFELLEKLYVDNRALNTLWRDSLILVGNIAEHAQANIKIARKMQEYNFHLIEEAFRNIFNFKKQQELIPKHLPEMGIGNFYLGMYPEGGGTDHVRVVSSYENNTCAPIRDEIITVEEFLVSKVLRSDYPNIFIVFPIHSDNEQLGISITGVGPPDGTVYERIATQLNTASHEAVLLHRLQRHADHLEEKVQARTRELKLSYEQLEIRNTRISQLYKTLEFRSKQDGLTGLFNRTAVYDFLEKGFESFGNEYCVQIRDWLDSRRSMDKQYGQSLQKILEKKIENFSVIMIDIDHFKEINDTYGHLFGDLVLRELGKLFKSEELFRNIDVCGRFGGEEFIVVLPLTEPSDAVKTAARLSRKLAQTRFRFQDQDKEITLSMGIAMPYPEDNSIEEVINRADIALYYAKENGRNRIINYEDVKEELQ